jgi:proliferating cell nuclear antigen PCNA
LDARGGITDMQCQLGAPKAGLFREVFDLVGQFTDDVTLCWEGTGLFVQGIDSAHAVLFQVELPSAWFDSYTNDGGCIVIGLQRKSLAAVLACRGREQSMSAEVSADGNELGLSFTGDGGAFGRDFALQGYDFGWERLDVPVAEHDSDIVLSSRELLTMAQQLAGFGDDVNVVCNDDGAVMTSRGGDVTMSVALPVDSLVEYNVAEDGVNCVLVAKFLAGAAAFAKLSRYVEVSNEVSVHFNTERPMEMRFDLGESGAAVRIVVCPRIGDEDDYADADGGD